MSHLHNVSGLSGPRPTFLLALNATESGKGAQASGHAEGGWGGGIVPSLKSLKGDMVFSFFLIFIYTLMASSLRQVGRALFATDETPPAPSSSLGVFLTSPAAATKLRGAFVPFCFPPHVQQ